MIKAHQKLASLPILYNATVSQPYFKLHDMALGDALQAVFSHQQPTISSVTQGLLRVERKLHAQHYNTSVFVL